MSSSSSSSSSGVNIPRIQKLDEVVINRIAAGEVVQKPSAAIKEMMENSIDARSTAITVTAKGGGLEFLQIQDNGHGIHYKDLPILCERFTTSKLKSFDDLKTISTFGFRGEALASITHVANVTILSKTADSPCAYKSKYMDGKLVPLKPGDRAEPKPCAGVVGTTITVEDLFYNMPARKSSFKNQNEQYQKILDVVIRYSIHFASRQISFTCKKQGQFNPDFHSPIGSTSKDCIRIAFGSEVAQELLEISVSQSDVDSLVSEAKLRIDSSYLVAPEFQMTGLISNANYSCKKNVLILFINNRLIENASIKKVIDAVYGDILPKHAHPFVYLSLTMPSENIDVNVHPTKKEVHFLHEDVIVDVLYQAICNKLKGSNASRVFHVAPVIVHHTDVGSVSAAEVTEGSQKALMEFEDSADIDSGISEADIIPTQVPVSVSHFTRYNSNSSIDSDPTSAAADVAISTSSKRGSDTSVSIGIKSLSSFAAKTSSKSTAPPPNKFVRTDSKQIKINEIFRAQATVAPSKSSFSAAASDQPAKDTLDDSTFQSADFVHKPYCNLSSLQFCVPISDRGSDSSSASNKDNFCNCCGSATEIVASSIIPQIDFGSTAFEIKDTKCEYASIKSMIAAIYQSRNEAIDKILQDHTYVGVVDSTSFVVQHGTKLLLLDYSVILHKMISQLVIRQFGELGKISVNPPFSIQDNIFSLLKEYANDTEEGILEEAEQIVNRLVDKAELLREYFNIEIDDKGRLHTLPLIIPQLVPEFEAIPLFLVMLCTKVDWESEVECFSDISSQLGFLYSYLPEKIDDEIGTSKLINLTDEALTKFRTILYPAIRKHYIPGINDGVRVVQIAALEELYKVFERC